MTIVDATTALPYLGDDPAQVVAFQEGVDSARGHLSTFSSDLGTARSVTNAAWHATEADLADTRTDGILTLGQAITSSLAAGSRAVGVYLEVLTQGRHAVDGLRVEWDLARAQATALEARPLATIDDERTATAEAGRLTDQFDELQRRFKVVVTTIETAANDCSQALNAASTGTFTSDGAIPASFQLAGFSSSPPEDKDKFAWWQGDKTLRHNTARHATFEQVKADVIATDGDPSRVTEEFTVINGSKNNPGTKDGRADVVYVDRTKKIVYVWEVKGSENSGPPLLSQATLAAKDVQLYIPYLTAQFPADYQVLPGFKLSTAPTVDYTTKAGVEEHYTLENTAGPGGVLYAPPPPPESESAASTTTESESADPTTTESTPSSVEPDEPRTLGADLSGEEPQAKPAESGAVETPPSEQPNLWQQAVPPLVSLDPEVIQEREDRIQWIAHILGIGVELLNPWQILAG